MYALIRLREILWGKKPVFAMNDEQITDSLIIMGS